MNGKRILFFIFFAALCSSTFAQLPPLIEREVFFGDPEISGSQISPDGQYISFLKPFNNIRNIWVKKVTEPFEKAKPITADESRPIGSYFWSRDSKNILYVQDKGGDENFRIYAVDPNGEGNPVPEAKDLTPMDKVRAMIFDVPKDNPDEILVGLNDRDPQLHDVYKIKISTGERTLVRENKENVVGWLTDLDGNLRLGVRQTQDGGSEILKIDGDSLTSIYKVNNEESAGPLRFMPGGEKFYMITDKGERDKSELVLFDIKTGKTELVDKDPLNEVDLSDVIFSEITNEILATVYTGAKRRIYPKNEMFAKALEVLKSQVPEGDIYSNSMTSDENVWLVAVTRDVDPGSVYLFDRTTGKAELLYKSRPNLPSENLAEMTPVTYKSRDGLDIPAYLTLPKGVEPKNLPVVMLIHGGPWARDQWSYSGLVQFLANRGYAVFQPNFRGSTGYGKKFLNAGNKQWGTGYMQHDITDGVKYLEDKGIADPKRVAIAGGSYGGYATLAGLAFTPDVYAAGFDIVGPSNIITLLKSIPPYWEPIRKIFNVRVGNMDDPKEKIMLEEQSPLNSADKITAPLYVVQGANDPRVKKAEADQIVLKMRELGRPVEYMVAPDEGHGFAGLENRVAMFAAMEKFLAKHLNGRYEEELRPEIKKRLDEITVDINSVTLPKVEEVTGGDVKFDGSKIVDGVYKYAISVDARGQKMEMASRRNISKDGNKIIVIDEVTGMMAGVDTVEIDAATLLPIKRGAKQGPATINISFTKDAVEGKILMGQQTMPISVKLDEPVLSDGANIDLAVGTLPFSEGYKTSVKQFDLMSASVKTMNVECLGSEKITAAGTEYDTYKVTIIPVGETNGTTIWIDKKTGVQIKSEMKLGAQMGGGTVVSILTK
ncbi:MAG: S9 family peptidase [Ignavibacteriaceae bacterium]|nr:S9 family peptidase [Ignavibacteriaceae bacterium]